MGTRGFVGVVDENGREKIGYVQFDAYPEGVGLSVLRDLEEELEDKDAFVQKVNDFKVVDFRTPPTEEEQEKLAPFADLGVSERSLSDWYCLLRNTQGRLRAMLRAGYVLDASEFPFDAVFCEWGYLVDVQRKELEVYTGYNTISPNGRFFLRAAENGDDNPVSLLISYSFDDLPHPDIFLNETALGEDLYEEP